MLWEKKNFSWNPAWSVANAGVTDLRNQVACIAAEVYGYPCEKLWMIGVTGTNGKTSVSYWLAQCLSEFGKKTALVGTLGSGVYAELSPSINTTPDAIELQEQLAAFAQIGVGALAMEVSSHALAQGRVNGVKFDVVLLTNVSRDHLDYHGDMDSYVRAKARLFAMPEIEHAVLNVDDPVGALWAEQLSARGDRVVGYGFAAPIGGAFPVLRASDVRLGAEAIEFALDSPWGKGQVRAPVVGRFNALNLLAVLGGLLESGVSIARALELLEHIEPVCGRMQRLGGGDVPLVLVDYAHTPDALEKALQAARERVAPGRQLVCVFGCGGGRDRGKRPLMGSIAARRPIASW